MTDADIDYEGSISLDPALLEAADIVENEQVDVYDITNGQRLTTYALRGKPGSGEVCINGAAARLVRPGDLVIVASYVGLDESEVLHHEPRIVQVDEENRPLGVVEHA